MQSFVLQIEGGIEAGRELCVRPERPCTIGRAPGSDFRLPEDDARASRNHARLEVTAGELHVHDLGSKNGTYVNGQRVTTALLRPGDRLRAGRTVFLCATRRSGPDTVIPDPAPRPTPNPTPVPPPIAVVRDPGLPTADSSALLPCDGCGEMGAAPAGEHFEGASWLCDPCAAARTERFSGEPASLCGFEILRVAARSGIGIAYEARDPLTRAHLSLELLLPSLSSDLSRARRFIKEQWIAISLLHPRIVRCYHVGHDQSARQLFLACEWIGRGDARQIAAPNSDLALSLRLGADLFEALGYLHALGLLHRDVKPENLRLANQRGQTRGKLGAYGVVKNLRESGNVSGNASIERDLDGGPLFLAPEQVLHVQRVGPGADLYGAMATLYFLLTGHSPLALPGGGRDLPAVAVLSAILAEARIPLASLRPDVPSDLAAWIDRALARDPAAREDLFAGAIADRLRREADALP